MKGMFCAMPSSRVGVAASLLGGCFVIGSLTAGCGSQDFTGGETVYGVKQRTERQPLDPPPAPEGIPFEGPRQGAAVLKGEAFGLDWSCLAEQLAVEVLDEADGEGRNVTLGGAFCEDTVRRRDVIFVLDVSGSMRGGFFRRGNDPIRSGTCGSREAVRQLVEASSFDAGAARFAVVTFDGRPEVVSEAFASADVFLDAYDSREILCHAGNGTNYGRGLAAALPLLDDKRPDAALEVYFLSDGYPQDDGFGKEQADFLKAQGIMATLMLGGDDRLLKEELASRDSAGEPWHAFAPDAESLASKLAGLSEKSRYTRAKLSLFHLMPDGSHGNLVFEDEVSLPSSGFGPYQLTNVSPEAEGLHLRIEYSDDFGRTSVQSGDVQL